MMGVFFFQGGGFQDVLEFKVMSQSEYFDNIETPGWNLSAKGSLNCVIIVSSACFV